MYVGQGSSQPVVQDSGPASGGGLGLGLGEQLLVARGIGAAPYANAGTGPNGTNWCDYDAPITNVGGYHFICIGPNSLGGALIDIGSGGGAANQPLSIIVNGISYPFPGSLSSIIIGTTPVTGGSNGACLYVTGTVVGQTSCGVSSITSLTGDVTATGPGAATATLATVNSNIGTFGSTSNVGVFTVNGKGLITAASNTPFGVTVGTTAIVSGTTNDLLYNNGGVLGNQPVSHFLVNGTGINITGTTTATVNCLLATSSVVGCVEGDGSTLTINGSGVISCTTATSSQIGCVEPDGTIITDIAGAITVAKATSSAFGVIEGDGSTLTITAGVAKCTTATTGQLGCVKPDGSTVTISGGVISSTASASSITVGTTGVISGTTGELLFANGGTLGNVALASLVTAGPGISVTGSPNPTITNTGETVARPGGRLVAVPSTCSASTSPIQTADVANAGAMCYVPYASNYVPINGANYTFATLTLTPTAAVAGDLYDIFAVVSSGSAAICYDTNAWTNASTRADGIQQSSSGYYTNSGTIATCSNNGSSVATSIGSGAATYLGTFFASATSHTEWTLSPAPATGGTSNLLGVYNAYNRVRVQTVERELTSSWTYGSGTWRPENNSTANRISVVDGLGLSQVSLTEIMTMSYGTSTGPQAGSPGICVNCTSTPAVTAGNLAQLSFTAPDQGAAAVVKLFNAAIGFTFYQAVEAGTPGVAGGPGWFGNYASGLYAEMDD